MSTYPVSIEPTTVASGQQQLKCIAKPVLISCPKPSNLQTDEDFILFFSTQYDGRGNKRNCDGQH